MGLCDWLFGKEIDDIPTEKIEPKRNYSNEDLFDFDLDDQEKVREYQLKPSLMTRSEKAFYVAIKKALPEEYILQPQVYLATIIKKISSEHFQNELYRNIDFCIFDLDFRPIALIEINDETHATDKSRQARDYKVKEICQAAGIPLIRFWTSYGVNQEYINKKIKEVLETHEFL